MSHAQKSYDIVNNSTFSTKHLEVRHNNTTILWIERQSPFLGSPTINLHTTSATGPIIASTKLKSMTLSCRVSINGIDHEIKSESLSGRQYGSTVGKKRYMWKRTHSKGLGASSWGNSDFKLVDASCPEEVLAAFIKEKKMFSEGAGRMDWFGEVDREVEVMALAAILGIVEQVRRQRAAGGGGGGGGA